MANAPLWTHTIRLEASPRSARQARDFVLQHLVDHRMLSLADPVRLVASELATNALVHAQTAFTITLAADDHRVLLTVQDDSASLPARRDAKVMDPSGRGLEIVEIVSTDWGVVVEDASSKAVWASFATGQVSGLR